MCASCGCGIPEETHGDERNLLWSQICEAAEAQGIAVNDVVNNVHAMAHQSHKVDQTADPAPIKDAKTKGLRKVVRTLSDEISDAIIKGQRREEKGRFVPGKDDTHSHRRGEDVVTHTHEGEKGHLHPAREYGPSFHHR